MSRNSLSKLFFLAAIILGVFFTELGSPRLWDRDEPRNSRASHEMLERGDWIVPTFNGELRDHKPILLYWGQMVSYLTLGESEFSARLPSALGALLSVIAVAVLASRLSGKKNGLSRDGYWAAGALGTCLLFVMAGRAATPDACLIAFSTLGIAALVIASITPALPYSSGRVGPARWWPAMFGYAMLGLAALAKGPVGIILPLTVVHLWWLICNRMQELDPNAAISGRDWTLRLRSAIQMVWRTFNPWQCLRAVWALRAIPGLMLCLLVAAPWYIAVGVETEGAFLRGFFLEHNLGRAVGSMEGHSGSILFYPMAMLVGTFPWSMWLIPILLWCRSASRASPVQRQMVVLAGTWVAVYVGAFSMASTKLPSYITPCYAGAALAIGSYLRQFESTWAMPSIAWRRTAHALTIGVGVAIAVGITWLSESESMPLLASAAWCGLVIVTIGCLGIVWEMASRAHWVPATWLVGAAVFQIILFGFGAKSIDFYRTDLQLLTRVDRESPTEHWLTLGGLEPSWVHYLNHPIVEVTTGVQETASWEAVVAFLKQHPDGHVIAVGDEANQRIADLRHGVGAGQSLKQLDHADRFLRPGQLAVYGLQVVENAVSAERPPHQEFTINEIVTGDGTKEVVFEEIVSEERIGDFDTDVSRVKVPALTVAHPRQTERNALPVEESEVVENNGMRAASSASGLTSEQFPNPLRQPR